MRPCAKRRSLWATSTRSASTSSSTPPRWSGMASAAVEPRPRGLPFLLSVIAGATDTIGFLGLDGLFTAHVTGNLVVIAAHLVSGIAARPAEILAVPVFMLVVGSARLFAGACAAVGLTTLRPLLLLQALLLASFLGLGAAARSPVDPDAAVTITAGMFGVAAMAVQNALVRIALPGVPSTAVMTTNVTHFMLDIGTLFAVRDPGELSSARRRAKATWPPMIGFALGCALGAACEIGYGLMALALPTGLALLAAAASLGTHFPQSKPIH
jgi:uncharacterized membrane protein YoaK (UPF0700 family)